MVIIAIMVIEKCLFSLENFYLNKKYKKFKT